MDFAGIENPYSRAALGIIALYGGYHLGASAAGRLIKPPSATSPIRVSGPETAGTAATGGELALVEPGADGGVKAAAGTLRGSTYTFASGNDISKAVPDEFVLKNGSEVWGQITENLTQGRPDVPIGELRVQVGDQGYGLVHTKKHEQDILKIGYESAEQFIPTSAV
jgi:hypothetical protein